MSTPLRRPQPLPDHLRAGLAAVSAALLAHDGEHIVFSNDAMQRLLGRSTDELQQLAPEAWAAPAQQQLLRDYGRRCLDCEDLPAAIEIEALSASGTCRQLEITARRLDADTAAPPLVLLTCQDLSDIRLVQDILRNHQTELESIVARRTAELRQTHRELEAFMQNASVGIISTRDIDLRIGRGNRKFAEILELPTEAKVDELSMRRFFLDDAEFDELTRLTTNARQTDASLVHEMWLQTWNGRRIWVQLIAYASNPADDAPSMWWLLQDRSEVMRAQEELVNNYRNIQLTNARLEEAQNQLLQSEKMASIGQLAAGVAHEINNPIAFVNSNLGTLRHYAEQLLALTQAHACRTLAPVDTELAALQRAVDLDFIAEDLPSLLNESEDGLTRVRKIVQNLKDFSRVDHADWQDADLNAGLESTLNVVMNEVKYRADVHRHYGTLPPVRCLAGQLNQVFMNLIVNAAHAMAPQRRGAITLSTGMQPQADGDWVWVEVADDGCGMTPEVQRRIFEPFYTTKPVGQGTGLGLSMSFSIVQKHGGRIEVQSVPGEGTGFKVWVPVAGRPAA
ncbi:ATP-binding protein [Roseateles sp.]|uniref:ATP-binding protein n=1 Tax=Roseateles sp. TaxID=1971397 RepID=UPI0039ED5F5A